MTLRRRVSPVLRFGRLVDLDQQLAVDFRCRTLCRRLLTVLLLSVVWRSWLSSALDPRLCVAGFSRFCSLSEQLYYRAFNFRFQANKCSNYGLITPEARTSPRRSCPI